MSQFKLLTSKRFLPLFLTQFFGAFNDNVFKNTLMFILAYTAATKLNVNSSVLLNLAAGLFILPFLLFSSIAGQICDKYEKSRLVRLTKLIELGVMSAAALAFYFEAYYSLLFLLFLMGTQSTLFGPVKYALLPQHLATKDLIGANALVEAATFVAILLGTIVAGFILAFDKSHEIAALSVLIFATIGLICSFYIPHAPSSAQSMKMDFNIWRSSIAIIRKASTDKITNVAILGISWFWFLGDGYLTQFPDFARLILKGDTSTVTLLLALFSVGIGMGSLLVEKIAKRAPSQMLVNTGLIGLALSGITLYLSTPNVQSAELNTWLFFISDISSLVVLISVLLIGLFGGLFIVPLYALVQRRAEVEFRARTIAVINIINALFMVLSAVFAMVLLGLAGTSIPVFLLILAVMNIAVFSLMKLYSPSRSYGGIRPMNTPRSAILLCQLLILSYTTVGSACRLMKLVQAWPD